jgi:hypothetical protein
MKIMCTASSVPMRKASADLSHPVQSQVLCAQNTRIRRLVDALQFVDVLTLFQIGIARDEIDRFAHTKVARAL